MTSLTDITKNLMLIITVFWGPKGIKHVQFCCTQKKFVLNGFNFILVAGSVTGLATGKVEGVLLKDVFF